MNTRPQQSSRAFVCSYSDRVGDPSHCIPRVFVPTPIVAMLLGFATLSLAWPRRHVQRPGAPHVVGVQGDQLRGAGRAASA